MQENVIIAVSPVAEAKAIKNEVETEGFRQCHVRDGAALVCSFIQSHLVTVLKSLGPIFLMAGGAIGQRCRTHRI